VETAACLWLEPGLGELRFESTRTGAPAAATGGGGERFAAGPLADLRERLDRALAGPIELTGRWRDEHARLHWSTERSHARGSAA
jgi:hypothetical protein